LVFKKVNETNLTEDIMEIGQELIKKKAGL
jgi:hypothetical protein